MQQEQNNVSCLNSRAIIEYVRREHPDRISDLLAAVPDQWKGSGLEEYLCDEDNWVTSACIVAMFAKAREIAGDEQAAFQIGYQSILHRDFGYWQKILVRFFSSPRQILRRLNQLNARLNNTKTVELVSDSPWHAVVRWHWLEGAVLSKDVCLYNQGIYSAIPTVWGRPAARVEERTCRMNGDPCCEIHISWQADWRWLGGLAARLFHGVRTAEAAIEEITKDKSLLKERFDELSDANRALRERVVMLKEINGATRALASLTEPQKVLERTMHTIVSVFGFDRAIIMLVDDAGKNLEFRYGVGESPEMMSRMNGYRVPLDRDTNLMVRVLRAKGPVRITDVESAGLNPTNRILADFRPSSFILCPLVEEGKPIGVLGADRRGSRARVNQADAEFLSIFANSIGTVFLHARLDEELRTSNVNSVRALVQAIEEKDPYTRGHSERVADYASQVARVLGFTDPQIEILHYATILHDVGKIGVPETIIHMPRALTPEEFEMIKEHPMKGVHILRHVPFIKDHLHIVRNHHERWDGRGYPDGLAGDAIPFEAQIVSVADAYDAMTSTRPYRAGMAHADAIAQIQDGAGSQFSGRIVEAFMEFSSARQRA